MDLRALQALRARRRRLSSASFFVAGIGFGTLIYLLRARFQLVRDEHRYAGAAALLVVTVAAFWLGARADAEVRALDEQIRDVQKKR